MKQNYKRLSSYCAIFFTFFLLQMTAFAQKPVKFSSVYINTDTCQVIEPPEDSGQDGYVICSGIDGFQLELYYSAMSEHISITKESTEFNTYISIDHDCAQQNLGKVTEWRLANGKPFAVICRVFCYEDPVEHDGNAVKTGEYLVVRGLEGFDFKKVIIVPKNPEANKHARDAADNKYKEIKNIK